MAGDFHSEQWSPEREREPFGLAHNLDAVDPADCPACVADDQRSRGTAGNRPRSCCPSEINAHHSSQCPFHGHMVEREYGGVKQFWETDNLPPGPIVIGAAMEDIGSGEEGLFLLGGPEGVRRRHPGVFADSVGFGYYRTCCSTAPGSPHWRGCGTNFFADGQTVIKPDFNPMDPWGPARLRIREDTVASDRTFENETRPL